MHRYGTVDGFDLAIVPRMKRPGGDQEEARTWIDTHLTGYSTKVRHGHYEIFMRKEAE